MTQEHSLPYIRTKFLTTILTTLITLLTNMAREHNGLIYVLSRMLYNHFLGDMSSTSNPIFIVLKNWGVLIVRCADVMCSVIIIFFLVHFIISKITGLVYRKVSKKRKEYLRELLWENIIPNMLDIGESERAFINQINTCNEVDKKQWAISLATITNLYQELMNKIINEGVFETVEGNKNLNKHYKQYIESIKLPLVFVIFAEKEMLLDEVCKELEKLSLLDSSYKIVNCEYKKIRKSFNNKIINTLKSNRSHKQLEFLFKYDQHNIQNTRSDVLRIK